MILIISLALTYLIYQLNKNNNMIISYKQLQQNFGGSSASEVVVRLKNAHVKFFIGKRNQPFTTLSALNSALGVTQIDNIEFDHSSAQNEIEVI